MDNATPLGIVITALLSAIAWLAKRLYDCPRPLDYQRLLAERDTLRAAADAATIEAKRLYDAREAELADLRRQLDELRSGVEHAEQRTRRYRADGGGRGSGA